MEPPAEDDPMDLLGSKGLLKKYEFVRIITDALTSLGFDKSAAHLQNASGIPLYNSTTKQFLKLVEDGKWDESIAALQGFQLCDEKAVKLLLLEQKYFEILNKETSDYALDFLKNEMGPLGVSLQRMEELTYKVISDCGEDTESVDSRSKVVEKLKNLLSPAVIPKRRLEYLLEKTLDSQRINCRFHNILDNDLSLCFDHHNCYDKLPSETVQTLETHTDEVWFVKFSHNGKSLASSSKDKSAIIWEMDAVGKFSLKHKLEGHEKPVVMVLWSPDDRQVITCGENEVIKRWDVESGKCVQSYEGNGVGSVSCGWIHDGSGIIGGMADRNIRLWTLDGIEQEHKLGQGETKLKDVAMTTGGKCLVSMGTVLLFFDRETRKVEKVITEIDIITSFSLSKDGKYILINLSSNDIHLWNIEGGQPYKANLVPLQFIIRSCFGGYKESFIASGSEDWQVYIWPREKSTIKPLRSLRGHTEAVKCVSWNPTYLHMLASASDDKTIRIWGLDKKLK